MQRILLPLLGLIVLAPGVRGAEDDSSRRDVIVKLTNAFRRARKLPPLKVNATLASVAQKHAENMARQDKYGDTDRNGHILDGKGPKDRVEASGYKYARFTENVGYTNRPGPARDLVTLWSESPAHRKNMLDPTVTEIGVGIARGRSGKYYGVQVFAKPAVKLIPFTASIRNATKQDLTLRIGKSSADMKAGIALTFKHKNPGPTVMVEVVPTAPAKPITATLENNKDYVITLEGGVLKVREDK